MTRGSRLALIGALIVVFGLIQLASEAQLLRSQSELRGLEPVATGVARQAQHVVLVILDSVPERVSRDAEILPNLVALARRGVRGVSRGPEETNTVAGVKALATGRTGDPGDVLEMFSGREFRDYTVFDDVVARGERIVLHGDSAWTNLLGTRDPAGAGLQTDKTRLYEESDPVFKEAAERIHQTNPAFSAIHISASDHLAHRYGTRGANYDEAMRTIDAAMAAFLESVVSDDTTVIVTSDHGSDLNGSHGGDADVYRNVGVVLAGRGVRPGPSFEMDSRAMPGLLAVLLGVRLPGGLPARIPISTLDLGEEDQAKIVVTQLEQFAEAGRAHGEAPSAAMLARVAEVRKRLEAGEYARALEQANPLLGPLVAGAQPVLKPSAMRSLWLALSVLLLAWGLVELLAPMPQNRAITAAAAIVLAGGVVVLPALRFAFMPDIKRIAREVAASKTAWLAVALVGVVAVLGLRELHRRRAAFLNGLRTGLQDDRLFVVFALVATALRLISSVPMMLACLVVAAWRASGLSWALTAVVGSALTVGFLVVERVVFALAGEDPMKRYLCAAAVGVVIAFAFGRILTTRARWTLLAVVGLLFLLWPFGYLRIPPLTTQAGRLMASVLALSATGALGLFLRVPVWIIAILPITLAYHAAPSHPLFWTAFAVHIGFLLACVAQRWSRPAKMAAIGILALSASLLMSGAADALSLAVLGVALFLAARTLPLSNLPVGRLALFSVFATFARYAVVDIFSHERNSSYGLGTFDLASGFHGVDDVRWTWAAALIALKMFFETIVVLVLVVQSREARDEEMPFVFGLLLTIHALGLGGSLETALSFGPLTNQLGHSLGTLVFHSAMSIAVGCGYLLLRALTSGRSAGSVAAERPS